MPVPKSLQRVKSSKLSPTERRNPRSSRLDRMSTAEAVRLMLEEESSVPRILLRHKRVIARAVDLISQALQVGGRLFYVGAGTSGRLGVLDASECPPTFRTNPEMVQGIIAGGDVALRKSVEGAEDEPANGAGDLEARGVTNSDVVVGIAASGTTPYVWGALARAKAIGAKTILVCFNPHLQIPRRWQPDLVLAPDLGPEILTGSTRLKAGTATKLLLNTFSTLSMVKLGKVISNLMVDVNPSNTKLRGRAIRIVRELTGKSEAAARKALQQSGWVVKTAVARLNR